jgi:hypothetical protein
VSNSDSCLNCAHEVVFEGFIEWARSLIETFAEMFRIQVFGTDVDESVVEEARNITHNQSRKVRARLSPQIDELTLTKTLASSRIWP